MKKAISLILIIFMVTTLLVSCGNKNVSSELAPYGCEDRLIGEWQGSNENGNEVIYLFLSSGIYYQRTINGKTTYNSQGTWYTEFDNLLIVKDDFCNYKFTDKDTVVLTGERNIILRRTKDYFVQFTATPIPTPNYGATPTYN